MKSKIVLASVLLLNIAGSIAWASKLSAQKGAQKKASPKAQLGTSFKFDGTALRGKYQTAFGTNATVENDKYLDDLLGGRKSFSDRIQKDNQRN